MKKIMILCCFLLLLINTAAGNNWLYDGKDGGRSYYQDTSLGFDEDSAASVNITCGTDSSNSLAQTPLAGTFGDADSNPDLLLSCGPDSQNAAPHLVMITDDLVQTDQITVTSGGDLLNNRLPMALCSYDGYDDTVEICLLNIEDPTPAAGFDTASIIIYSYNFSGAQEFVKIHEWYLNATGETHYTDSGEYNISNSLSTSVEQNTIYCDIAGNNPQCTVMSAMTLFKTNMTANATMTWIQELSYTPYDYIDYLFQLAPLYYGDEIYVYDDTTEEFSVINYTDGTVNRTMSISGIGAARYIAITDCSAADCESGAEIVIADVNNDRCGLYSASDGDVLEYSSLAIATNIGYCWTEDRDNDGTEELCGIGFDTTESGAGDSYVHCEELNLFAFDTIDTNFALNTTYDTSMGYPVTRADINNDNVSDFFAGVHLITLSGSAVTVRTIDSLITESGVTTQDIASIYIGLDGNANNTGTLISWMGQPANLDTYILTTTAGLPFEEIISGLAEFNLGAAQLTANPVCLNEELRFRCSYENGCVEDNDLDNFGLYIDCFSNGSMIRTASPIRTEAEWTCDLTNVSAGTYNITMTVYESGFEDNNDTFTQQFQIAAAGQPCNNETSPGDVDEPAVNLKPVFTGLPAANIPQPFCRDDAVIFTCENSTCYEDTEGDAVYFRYDCDYDGVYEGVSQYGTDTFGCDLDFNYTAETAQTIAVQIADAAHSSNLDGVIFTVLISNYTTAQSVAEGGSLCSGRTFYTDDGDILLPSSPEEASRNGIFRFVRDTGQIFNVGVTVSGWIFLLFISGGIFVMGLSAGMTGAVWVSVISALIIETIFVLSEIHSAVLLVIILVTAAAMISYKLFTRGE